MMKWLNDGQWQSCPKYAKNGQTQTMCGLIFRDLAPPLVHTTPPLVGDEHWLSYDRPPQLKTNISGRWTTRREFCTHVYGT